MDQGGYLSRTPYTLIFLSLSTLSAGAAFTHLSLGSQKPAGYWLAIASFLLLIIAQLAWPILLWRAPSFKILKLGMGLNALLLGLWLMGLILESLAGPLAGPLGFWEWVATGAELMVIGIGILIITSAEENAAPLRAVKKPLQVTGKNPTLTPSPASGAFRLSYLQANELPAHTYRWRNSCLR